MSINISSINNYNNQSFGKITLDNINLRKKTWIGKYKMVPGFACELEQGNKKDIKLINSIKENWREGTIFSGEMIENFLQGKSSTKLYLTQLKNKCHLIKNKICCLIETTNPKKHPNERDIFHINFVQSAPAILDKCDKSPIKGAGEIAMYEAVKIAKKEGYKDVVLRSVNDEFYDKIGFLKMKGENLKDTMYNLPQEKFDEFLARIKKKYNF